MKNKIKLPKITLILAKNNKKSYIYPSIRKTQFFLRNKANNYFKNGYTITIRVSYGFRTDVIGKRMLFSNEGTYENIEDLKLAFKAFIN